MDLSTFPFQLIAEPGKVRIGHNCANAANWHRILLVNPDVGYSTMDGFPYRLASGAFAGCIDLHSWCVVPPTLWLFLGVRRHVSGRLHAYVSLPLGLDPSPGWNDRCVQEALRVADTTRPSFWIIDFARNWRLV